jgi:hypothetical protein
MQLKAFCSKKVIEGFEETMCGMETTQPQFDHLGFLSNEQ